MNPQIFIYLSAALLIILIFLYLRNKKSKKEIQNLKKEVNDLIGQVEVFKKEYAPILDMEKAVSEQQEILDNEKEKTADEISQRKVELSRIKQDISDQKQSYSESMTIYKKLLSQINIYREDLELIAEGITPPVFTYSDPESYKNKLEQIYDEQKRLAKSKEIVIQGTSWTVNGSKAEGRKFMNQASKLAVRSFNNEANAIIKNVSWRNFESSETKLRKSFESINKFNESNNLRISFEYLDLRLLELTLTYEYQLKLQEQKEEIAEAKRAIREEEKLQSDILKAKKEEEKYEKLLEKAKKEAERKTGSDLDALHLQIQELSQQLEEAHKANERATSMAQQTRSGFVYIASNIGSFGEDIYKIGMTRRLEPMDRIRELSGASVPFIFDTHAMIYSTDAPGLETSLHNIFFEKRVNLANFRKEYFKVTLDEIEAEVKNMGVEYEFFRIPEADEYRKTLAMRAESKERKLAKEEFPEAI